MEVLRDIHLQPKLIMLDCRLPEKHKMVAKMLEKRQKKECDKIEKVRNIQLEKQRRAAKSEKKELQKVQSHAHKVERQAKRAEKRKKKHSLEFCECIMKSRVRSVKMKRSSVLARISQREKASSLEPMRTAVEVVAGVVRGAIGVE